MKKLSNDEFRDLTRSFLSEVVEEEERDTLLKEVTPGAAGQAAMGGLTPADQGFAAAAAENSASSIEKAKTAIEQQLNSLYHDHMLENADLIAILEQMINDINSGFVGEPT